MELFEKIRVVRAKKRFTVTEVAHRAKMPVSTYSMKETGKRTIKPEEFERIAEALYEPPGVFYSKNFHEKWNVSSERENSSTA